MKKILLLSFVFLSFFAKKTIAQTTPPPVSNTYTFDASGSVDPDGTITSFVWTQTSGTASTMTNANTPLLTVVWTTAGTYTYKLTVTDNDGGVSTQTVTATLIKAANKLPIINIKVTAITQQLP